MLAFDHSRPYRALFVDFNSFFASVEQQDKPELRGRPVGVVAVMADSSVLLAASREAKRFGLHTGTLIGDAKRICPDIQLVEATHGLYSKYHDRIVRAIETVRPIEKVCSVDEMWIRLTPLEADRESAERIATELKQAIRNEVGECVTCSIGLAPNAFLAKIGTEMQKPDGLIYLLPDELPHRIGDWSLMALPGINRRMAIRLNLAGIYTMRELLSADRNKMREAFGSVIGARWWHLLRGHDVPDQETQRRSLSHTNVLPPEFRNREGSYKVLVRLIEKATARLRREKLSAAAVTFFARARGERWEETVRLDHTRSTMAIMEQLRQAWKSNNLDWPTQVGVNLTGLRKSSLQTPSLFDRDNRHEKLFDAVDDLNIRFGKHTISPAVMASVKHTATEKIAFQKTSLFSEGAGDNAA